VRRGFVSLPAMRLSTHGNGREHSDSSRSVSSALTLCGRLQ
jgi:hypothetical protein